MVRYVFADTAYFLALSSRRDQLYPQARVLRARYRKALLTTEWVLMDPSPRGVREPASPPYGTWVRMLGPMRAQL